MDRHCQYALEVVKQLLAIDSPTGYTRRAAEFIASEFQKLGYAPKLTTKGNVLVDIGGEDVNDGLVLFTHIDTLGAVVSEIKSNGRLRISPIGGLSPNNIEAENCRILTRFDRDYEGTYQLCNASLHVNQTFASTERTFDTMEVVLDEEVFSREDTEKLGIMAGDYVCFEPRTRITESGYIKSRFLDDKLSVGIMLALASFIKEENILLPRRVYQYFTVYEEVGHGACSSIPAGTTEVMSVDMGCVGEGLSCRETQVSICAKDSHGPYNYDMVTKLICLAKARNLDYAVDIYPRYASDADAALGAGYEVRHALIGSGVYASHGYERSHVRGVSNTYELLKAYCLAGNEMVPLS